MCLSKREFPLEIRKIHKEANRVLEVKRHGVRDEAAVQ